MDFLDIYSASFVSFGFVNSWGVCCDCPKYKGSRALISIVGLPSVLSADLIGKTITFGNVN